MTAHGRYRVIEAQTFESLKTHRLLIEKALQNRNLPPELRAELEKELQLALRKEIAAKPILSEISADDEDDEDEGEDGTGSGDHQGSSSGESGGGMGHGDDGTVSEQQEGLSGLEMVALLFFLTEQDVALPIEAPVPTPDSIDYTEAFPLAAATLLFNREAKTAHIHEPYTLEPEGKPDAPSDLLPSLERHAAKLGAHVMQLKVHADAVSLFKMKGYQPHGKIVNRQGAPMQRMRRTLALNAPVPTDMT